MIRTPVGERDFLFSTTITTGPWGPASPLYNGDRGSFMGVKRPPTPIYCRSSDGAKLDLIFTSVPLRHVIGTILPVMSRVVRHLDPAGNNTLTLRLNKLTWYVSYSWPLSSWPIQFLPKRKQAKKERILMRLCNIRSTKWFKKLKN